MNKEPIYFVKPEQGIVVCKVTDCDFDALAFASKHSQVIVNPEDLCCDCGSCTPPYPENFYMNENYVGVAKLQDGDIFDEEYGKKLALRKALAKHDAALLKKVKFIQKDFLKQNARLVAQFENAVKAAEKKSDKTTALYETVLDEAR
jgi:hypothetical protein